MTLADLHKLGLPLEAIDTPTPVLVVDNTMLEHIERCRRYAYHLDVRRRTTTGFNMDLWWGGLMHECWAWWAGHDGAAPASDVRQAEQFTLIGAAYYLREETYGPLEDNEYRTPGRAKDHLAAFNRWYRAACEEAGGSLVEVIATERRFRHTLGVLGVGATGMDRPVRVDWTGIRDNDWRDRLGRLWCHDYKTGKDYKEEWLVAHHGNSAQFKGYCWSMAQEYGEQVAGTIITSATCRGPLVRPRPDSAPRDEFTTTELAHHPRALEEWVGDTLATIASFLRDGAMGRWPQSGSSCGDYGRRCAYWDVCRAPTKADGEAWLASGQFEPYQWNPLVGREGAVPAEVVK